MDGWFVQDPPTLHMLSLAHIPPLRQTQHHMDTDTDTHKLSEDRTDILVCFGDGKDGIGEWMGGLNARSHHQINLADHITSLIPLFVVLFICCT